MSRIYIDGIKTSLIGGGGSGLTILSGTSDPTSAEGEDGQEYLKHAEMGEDLTSFTSKIENANQMKIEKSRNKVDFTYVTGSTIGAQVYKQVDLTDIDEIKITISVGNKAYQSNFESWHPKLAITTTNPANNYITTDTVVENSTSESTNNYTVDVSSYTGNYYIVLTSFGCTGSFTSLIFDNKIYNIITNAKVKVNGAWQDLIGSKIEDVDLGT